MNRICLIILFFILTACGGNPDKTSSSEIPETGDRIVIRWHEDGGMLNESVSIYISKDSSYWFNHYNDVDQKIYLPISSAEVDSLVASFRRNGFDLISEIEEEEVYDRGGTSVDLSIDAQYWSKANSGMTFIRDQDYEAYAAVEWNILELVSNKLNEMAVHVEIFTGESLKDINHLLEVDMANAIIYAQDTSETNFPDKIEADLYPGTNEIQIYLMYRDSLNQYGGNIVYRSDFFFEEISDSNRIFRLELVEERIRLMRD